MATGAAHNNEIKNILIKLQDKEATANGVIKPDSGYDGLSQVTVNVSGGGEDIPTVEVDFEELIPNGLQEGTIVMPEDVAQKLTTATANQPPMIRLKKVDSDNMVILTCIGKSGNMLLYSVRTPLLPSNIYTYATVLLVNLGGTWYSVINVEKNIYIFTSHTWQFDEATHILYFSDTRFGNSVINADYSHIDVYPNDDVGEKFLAEFLASNMIIWNEEFNRVELQLKDTCTQEDIPPSLYVRFVVTNGMAAID